MNIPTIFLCKEGIGLIKHEPVHSAACTVRPPKFRREFSSFFMWCGIQKLLVTQSGEGISDLFPTPSSGSTPPCLTSCSPFHCAHHHPQNRSAHSQCPISCSAVSQKARKLIPRGGRGFFSFTKRTARFLTKKSRITHTRRQPPLPSFFFSSAFSDSANLHEHLQSFRRTDPASQSFFPFRPAAAPRRKWIGAQYFCGTEVPCRSRSTQQRWAFRAAAAAANLGHVCLLGKALPSPFPSTTHGTDLQRCTYVMPIYVRT